MNEVAIYGSGGHSQVVREILMACGFEVVETYDDRPERRHIASQNIRPGLRLVGAENFEQPKYPLLIAVGNNVERSALSRLLGTQFVTAVHPSAIISPTATIGEGTVIHHGAIVQANTRIGKHVLINTAASVDHDNVIGDFAHISPQVALSGHVEVGEGTHIGSGATVIPGVRIGKWCTIGAGTVVIADIPDYCTAVGSPARIISRTAPLSPVVTESRSTEFDLAFIGSGVSTSFTVLNLIENLNKPKKPLRLAIIDKTDDFHVGVPYGHRSGTTALLISTLDDFLPESEKETFFDWLTSNKSWAFEDFRAEAGVLSKAWLASHADDLANNAWGHLYLPRSIFGRWLRERMRYALESARSQGSLTYELINAEVLDVQKTESGFVLSTADKPISARQVVLAVGGPTVTKRFSRDDAGPLDCLINDPYEPSADATLAKIMAYAQSRRRKLRVLVLGANASALEMIYKLKDRPELDSNIEQYFMLSSRAELPHRMDGPSSLDFKLSGLEELSSHTALTAEKILDCATSDCAELAAAGYSLAQTLTPVSSAVMELVQRLAPAEKLRWANHGGNTLGRMQRRAGPDYLDAIVDLQECGRLSLLAGIFEGIKSADEDGYIVDATSGSGGAFEDLSEPFDVVINCAGGSSVVSEGSPPLIPTLVRNELCSLTPSGQGVQVNNNYEAAPGLYVMGPFLSGNVINGGPIWHLEHAGRIGGRAEELAQIILRSADNSRGRE